MNDLEMVSAKVYRMVSARRARKLRKRGEYVRWSIELNSYYWEPYWLAPNNRTSNGLPWVDHKTYLQQA